MGSLARVDLLSQQRLRYFPVLLNYYVYLSYPVDDVIHAHPVASPYRSVDHLDRSVRCTIALAYMQTAPAIETLRDSAEP